MFAARDVDVPGNASGHLLFFNNRSAASVREQ
jgi:hypothetical protein